MAKKRLLTWHRPSKRWKKQIDGVVRYFGYGKAENDTKSYKQAERRYLELLAHHERRQPIEIMLSEATVGDICEKYCQQLEQRYRRGKLSATYMDRASRNLRRFLTFLGEQVRFSSVGEILLEDYRHHVLSLMTNDDDDSISAWTAKERLGQLKTFINWAYEMRLCDLPRNLKKLAQVDLPEPEPKPFTVDEVHRLWDAASPRLRCFMALALNCGYGQQDISDLRVEEIDFDKGYIERKRSKTKIQTKHKLWPLTLERVKSEMISSAGPDDRAFKTANGTPLVTAKWKDGKLKRSDSIKSMFWRLQKLTGINGGRGFYSLRKTGATLIEQINPQVTEMYLGHGERGMRKHYAQRDWDALDVAIEECGNRLGLRVR